MCMKHLWTFGWEWYNDSSKDTFAARKATAFNYHSLNLYPLTFSLLIIKPFFSLWQLTPVNIHNPSYISQFLNLMKLQMHHKLDISIPFSSIICRMFASTNQTPLSSLFLFMCAFSCNSATLAHNFLFQNWRHFNEKVLFLFDFFGE